MTLAEYVSKVMEEKGLKAKDVERQSGGAISDSYVLAIKSGKSKRPSAKSLQGLATGLGVDYQYLSKIASGQEPGEGWTVESFADAVAKIAHDKLLGELVRETVRMKPEKLKRVLKYARRK